MICYRYNAFPQIVRGASAWSFIRVGNTVPTIMEGGNGEGPEAFWFRDRPASSPNVTNPRESEYDMFFPFNGDYGAPQSPDWSPNKCQHSEDITERETTPGFDYEFLNKYTYTYQDSGQSGSVAGTSDYSFVKNSRGLGVPLSNKETASWSISWQRTFQSCDDGGTAPSRPGGCAGCGDASQLQIL